MSSFLCIIYLSNLIAGNLFLWVSLISFPWTICLYLDLKFLLTIENAVLSGYYLIISICYEYKQIMSVCY